VPNSVTHTNTTIYSNFTPFTPPFKVFRFDSSVFDLGRKRSLKKKFEEEV
jgi:hypothetical protein